MEKCDVREDCKCSCLDRRQRRHYRQARTAPAAHAALGDAALHTVSGTARSLRFDGTHARVLVETAGRR